MCSLENKCDTCEDWDVETWAICSGFLADRIAERSQPQSPSSDSNSTRQKRRLQRREEEVVKLSSAVVSSLVKHLPLPLSASLSSLPPPGSAGSSTVTGDEGKQSLCFARDFPPLVPGAVPAPGGDFPSGPPGLRVVPPPASCCLRA